MSFIFNASRSLLSKLISDIPAGLRQLSSSAVVLSKRPPDSLRGYRRDGSVKSDVFQEEKALPVDTDAVYYGGALQPTEETFKKLFDGVRYDQLPVLYIKASRNNTIITLADYKGQPMTNTTCGMVGFKKAKRGTTIAAQTAGMEMAENTKKRGFPNIRVIIKGLGPGRSTVLKGLQLGGINIVSITDNTTYPTSGVMQRPRKQRRL